MGRWSWLAALVVLTGCPTEGGEDATGADAGSATLDASENDAPGLDAFVLDAYETLDARPLDAVGLDAVGLDALVDDARDAFASPVDGTVSDAPPASDPHIVALSVGKYDTCVIDRDHRLWCWGRDQVPTRLADWTDVERVDTNGFARCAARADGLWCWGEHTALGPTPVTTPLRVTLPLPPPISSIAVGGTAICVVAGDGTHCWGAELLALGSDGVAPIDALADTVALAATEGAVCAVSDSGALRCWGGNINGRLGDGSMIDRRRPTAVVGLTDVTSLQLGIQSSCATTTDGSGWCWGWNLPGTLGDGTTTDSVTPRSVLAGPYVTLTQGWYHGAGVRSDGTVMEWGTLRAGIGAATPVPPTPVPAMPRAVHVEAGQDHTCALALDGEVYCWGNRQFLGRPGGDSTEAVRVYLPCEPACPLDMECIDGACVDLPPPPPPRDAGSVGAQVVSLAQRCAVFASGDVACRGPGFLGDGTPEVPSSALPRLLPSIADAVEVASLGVGSVCVRRADGSVWCWGDNRQGEVGDGTLVERRSPVRVVGLPPVVRVVNTWTVFVAMTESGDLWLWGGDVANLARAPAAGNRARPVLVAGTSGLRDVAAAFDGLCTLDTSGTVRCWTDSAPISTVVTDPTLRTITGRREFGCALGAELRCWGLLDERSVTADVPIAGFAGARAACGGSFDDLVVVDSFGDTYLHTGLRTEVPAATACWGSCAITGGGGVVWTRRCSGPLDSTPHALRYTGSSSTPLGDSPTQLGSPNTPVAKRRMRLGKLREQLGKLREHVGEPIVDAGDPSQRSRRTRIPARRRESWGRRSSE